MRVVVGLSGGVDSSVAAGLLLEAGHEVIGLYMRNWHDDQVTVDNACPWVDDAQDAMLVAEHLGVPFQVLDLSDAYKSRIVDYMFAAYAAGLTPNPDVLCNREIKFDLFVEAAKSLGAEAVATGHYCRNRRVSTPEGTQFELLSGVDPDKDQSYFLCQVTQEQLAFALFPVGDLRKSEVRDLARKWALPTAEKKDSQGLCFVGKIRLPVFLQQSIAPKDGDIREIAPDHPKLIARNQERFTDPWADIVPVRYEAADGLVVGTHPGAQFYTVGQRKGLMVGGKALPLFVLSKDVHTNTLYVGMGSEHPGLLRRALRVQSGDVHWVNPSLQMKVGEESRAFQIRFRYRQPLQSGKLEMREDGLYIQFDAPQTGIAAGQFAAWYLDDQLAGSGSISD
jgi:tRNA-specific 2-thiouridylase